MILHGQMYLYIDGYNIINGWPELQKLSRLNLDLARERLIEICSEYQAYSGIYIIIVFDAHLQKSHCAMTEEKLGVKIVFTKEGQTADQYIEQEIDKYGQKRKITVATSDFLEQQLVMGRGARRISARELEIQIKHEKKIYMEKRKNHQYFDNLKEGAFNSLDHEEMQKLMDLKERLSVDREK